MATYTVTLALTDLQERALRNRKTREGRDAVPNQTYLEAAAALVAGPAFDQWVRDYIEALTTRSQGGETLTSQETVDLKAWLRLP